MKFRLYGDKSKQAAIEYIQKLPDKPFTCTIERERTRRSIDQNSLYWLWLSCISHETGGDKDAIHDYFKDEFLPKETVKSLPGIVYDRPVSTSKLDTVQFTQYLEKVQVFASSELGIVLPSPVDKAFEAFEEFYKNRI